MSACRKEIKHEVSKFESAYCAFSVKRTLRVERNTVMSLSAFSIKSQAQAYGAQSLRSPKPTEPKAYGARVKPKPIELMSALSLEAPLDAEIAPQKDKGDDELSGAQLLTLFAAPEAFFDAEGF